MAKILKMARNAVKDVEKEKQLFPAGGVETSTVTLEISVEVPQKARNRPYHVIRPYHCDDMNENVPTGSFICMSSSKSRRIKSMALLEQVCWGGL